jgi:hypothetical protein
VRLSARLANSRTAHTGWRKRKLLRFFQSQLDEARERAAALGTHLTGGMVKETARIEGEKITAILRSRLDRLLEGMTLHKVGLDDVVVHDVVREIGLLRGDFIAEEGRIYGRDPLNLARLVAQSSYLQMLESEVGLGSDEVRSEIERRRLMPDKNDGSTTIYNVQGDHARWNVNSTDNSVNIINTKSPEEFFATLRGRIESEVAEGDERRKIIEALTALEGSHGKPSFAHRYTDFMALAANHMAVLLPFIPALTEMLHKVLPLAS